MPEEYPSVGIPKTLTAAPLRLAERPKGRTMSRKPRSRKVQKLIERLATECELDVPEDVELRRTYAGYDQKSAGAWSWVLASVSKPWQIAGFEALTIMLQHPYWDVSYNIHGDCELDSYKKKPTTRRFSLPGPSRFRRTF